MPFEPSGERAPRERVRSTGLNTAVRSSKMRTDHGLGNMQVMVALMRAVSEEWEKDRASGEGEN